MFEGGKNTCLETRYNWVVMGGAALPAGAGGAVAGAGYAQPRAAGASCCRPLNPFEPLAPPHPMLPSNPVFEVEIFPFASSLLGT